VLCNDRGMGNALRTTVDERWVHVVCAIWIPGTHLTFIQGPGEIEYLRDIDISDVPQAAFRKTCYLCRRSGGACMDCAEPGCGKSFHVTCAR
jgi:hypothetical protein